MTLSRRYRWVLLLAGTAAFGVMALVMAVWPLVGGMVPAGTHAVGELATLTVRNTDGNPGVRSADMESLLGIPGVRSVHYARPSMVRLSRGDSGSDEIVAYVNEGYFRSLGVGITGPGFPMFSPWQRNLECTVVMAASLAKDFGHSPESTLVGSELTINGKPCRVVGIADGVFPGMRPTMRVRLWISWPAQVGDAMRDTIPAEALDEHWRAREAGIVFDPVVPLGAIEVSAQAVLSRLNPNVGEVQLLPGDGVDPWARHRMLKEARLFLLAVGVLLGLTLVFSMTYALWHSEAVRRTQGVRQALGATTRRLVLDAARQTLVQVALSIVAGFVVARITWGLLLAHTGLGSELLQLPAALPWRAILGGAAVVVFLGFVTVLVEVRPWVLSGRPEVDGTIRRFAATDRIETGVGAIILAGTLTAMLLTAWILDDFRRLRATPRGYGNSDITAVAFAAQPGASPLVMPVRTRAGHSVAAVIETLAERAPDARVAMSQAVPFGQLPWEVDVTRDVPGRSMTPMRMMANGVSDNFFAVWGIAFVEGSGFSSPDAREVILSVSAARTLLGDPPWAGRNMPIGMDHMNGSASRVVGVVRDVAYRGRNSAIPDMLYVPARDMGEVQVVSLAEPVPAGLRDLADVLREMGITDPLAAPVRIRDRDAEDDRSGSMRAMALLATCLAAVVLGALGLGEILLVIARRRMHELALRSALGATANELAWTAFRKQVPALLLGMSCGAAVFAAAAHHLVARGFGVTPPAPATVVLALAAVLALVLLVLVPSLLTLRRIPTALLLKQD